MSDKTEIDPDLTELQNCEDFTDSDSSGLTPAESLAETELAGLRECFRNKPTEIYSKHANGSLHPTLLIIWPLLKNRHERMLNGVIKKCFHDPELNQPDSVISDAITAYLVQLENPSNARECFLECNEGLYLCRTVINECKKLLGQKKKNPLTNVDQDLLGVRIYEAREDESRAIMCLAVLELEPELQRVLLVSRGEDLEYNKKNGKPPKSGRGHRTKFAAFFSLTPARWDKRLNLAEGKVEALRQKFSRLNQQDQSALAQAVQGVLDNKFPGTTHFQSPFCLQHAALARFCVRLIGSSISIPTMRMLLRAVAQADLIDEPQDAENFLQQVRESPQFQSASVQEQKDVLVSTAILYDHSAAHAERAHNLEPAARLLCEGLQLLDQALRLYGHVAHWSITGLTAAEEEELNAYNWCVIQHCVLSRRLFFLQDSLSLTQSVDPVQVKARLSVLEIEAPRTDHRLSACHHLLVWQLLEGQGETALSGFVANHKKWMELYGQCEEGEKGNTRRGNYLIRGCYELRRAGNCEEKLLEVASDVGRGRMLYESAVSYYDQAQDLALATCNFRIGEEIRADRDRLEATYRRLSSQG